MNDGWCKVWDYGWSASCLDDVGLVSFPSFVGPLTYDQDVLLIILVTLQPTTVRFAGESAA